VRYERTVDKDDVVSLGQDVSSSCPPWGTIRIFGDKLAGSPDSGALWRYSRISEAGLVHSARLVSLLLWNRRTSFGWHPLVRVARYTATYRVVGKR